MDPFVRETWKGAKTKARGLRTRGDWALQSCNFQATSLGQSCAFRSIISPLPISSHTWLLFPVTLTWWHVTGPIQDIGLASSLPVRSLIVVWGCHPLRKPWLGLCSHRKHAPKSPTLHFICDVHHGKEWQHDLWPPPPQPSRVPLPPVIACGRHWKCQIGVAHSWQNQGLRSFFGEKTPESLLLGQLLGALASLRLQRLFKCQLKLIAGGIVA